MSTRTESPLEAHLSTLPEYAETTARLSFLYSSLPPRKVSNPTGYATAISWWRGTLFSLVEKGLLGEDKLILVADDGLKDALRWPKVGTPTSLGAVLSELSSTDLIELESFLSSSPSTPTSWLSLLSTPLWWSFSKLRTSIASSSQTGESAEESEWNSRKGSWVVKPLVEEVGKALTPKLNDLHTSTVWRLYTPSTFHATIASITLPDVVLSERDSAVLAKWFQMKGMCIIGDGVIKFAAPLTTSPIPAITSADASLLTLLTTLQTLSSYITSLEKRIAEQHALAVEYTAKKQKVLAKSHLVSRTIQALSLGTTVLRSILDSPTLSLTNIEKTNEEFADAMADVKDIESAMKDGDVQLDGDGEEEVSKELEEMIREEEMKEKAKKEAEALEQRQKAEREKKEAEARLEEAQRAKQPEEKSSSVTGAGERSGREGEEKEAEKVRIEKEAERLRSLQGAPSEGEEKKEEKEQEREKVLA